MIVRKSLKCSVLSPADCARNNCVASVFLMSFFLNFKTWSCCCYFSLCIRHLRVTAKKQGKQSRYIWLSWNRETDEESEDGNMFFDFTSMSNKKKTITDLQFPRLERRTWGLHLISPLLFRSMPLGENHHRVQDNHKRHIHSLKKYTNGCWSCRCSINYVFLSRHMHWFTYYFAKLPLKLVHRSNGSYFHTEIQICVSFYPYFIRYFRFSMDHNIPCNSDKIFAKGCSIRHDLFDYVLLLQGFTSPLPVCRSHWKFANYHNYQLVWLPHSVWNI